MATQDRDVVSLSQHGQPSQGQSFHQMSDPQTHFQVPTMSWLGRRPRWQLLSLLAIVVLMVGFGAARWSFQSHTSMNSVAAPKFSVRSSEPKLSQPLPTHPDGPAVAANRILVPTTSPATPTFAEPTTATAAGLAFLRAWQHRDYAAMQRLQTDPNVSMKHVYGGMAQRLRLANLVVKPHADPANQATKARIPFTVTMSFTGFTTPWSYRGQLQVIQNSWRQFRVQFTPATVYPGLAVGQKLQFVPAVSSQPSLYSSAGISPSDGVPWDPRQGERGSRQHRAAGMGSEQVPDAQQLSDPQEPTQSSRHQPEAGRGPAAAGTPIEGQLTIAITTAAGEVVQHLTTLTPGSSQKTP